MLRRSIRLPHAIAMVAGTIIGASIFVQPSEVTGRMPSLGGAAAVWLTAGLLTLLGSLVVAELASTFPKSGGVYVFLREAYSPLVGFLWGWAMLWIMHSGIIAVIAVIFARYLGYFVPLGPLASRLVAVAAIVVLSVVNYVGVESGSRLQTALTAIKVAAIALMIGLGFALFSGEAPRPLPAAGLEGGSPRDFLLALAAALFAFGGWHMVTYNAEETVDPRRTIPRALLWGILIVTVSYVGLNAVYFHVLPIEQVIASDRIAADAADAVVGFGGGAVMSALVVVSTFGALTGIILSGPRVYYAMARDGLLFRRFARLHPRFQTPSDAIVLQGAWSAILVLTETYRALFMRVIYTEWLFFAALALAIFPLRRRSELRRGFSLWGYPVTPVLFAASALAIVINQLVSDPAESLIGLSFLGAGVPVFFLWNRWRASRQEAP
ncbi:MAG: amino acid permease [Acidobacteria bacterium]|nr:amino acid permease [Acidobacteriota bacterium]